MGAELADTTDEGLHQWIVKAQGWVCLNVMMWLLGWRIHCWWQRCSNEVVRMLHHDYTAATVCDVL